MTLTSGGNLLVGTTTDSGEKLQVNGNIQADGRILINAGNGNQLYLNNAGQRYTQITFDNNSTSTSQAYLAWDATDSFFEMYAKTGGGLKFYANATERMRITSGGNVGIGNISAVAKLHVTGNLLSYSEAANTAALFIAANNSYNWQFGINNGSDYVITENGGVNAIGTTRFSVKPGGNVLVGTTTDTGYKLNVNGGIYGKGITADADSTIGNAIYGYGQVLSGSSTNALVQLDTTWNTTGNADAIVLNVSNTASGASSRLLDLKVNSSSVFNVKRNGRINASSLPTSSAGLSAGDIWNDGGTLKIV